METIINNKTGFLIDNVTPEKIAEKIDFLANNKQLAKKMGKEAEKYAKRFDWSNILPLFEKKAIELVEKKNKEIKQKIK